MGLKRSAHLVNAFPNYPRLPLPAISPELGTMSIAWLAGFLNADGSFAHGFFAKDYGITSHGVSPCIKFTQHSASAPHLGPDRMGCCITTNY